MDKILYKLDTFEDPLDLLLTLIQKNKVSIYDIPIVEITAQYLEAIDGIEEANLDNTSEFLVMASNLLYIKSKMLLPKNEEEEDEEDPQAHFNLTFGEEGTQADFKSHRARTRNGEAGANGHVDHDRIEQTIKGMCAAGSLLQVIASRISHRHNGEKGKAYTRNAEANESPNEVIAGSLAHGGGEDEIACAEQDREQHQADRDKALVVCVLHSFSNAGGVVGLLCRAPSGPSVVFSRDGAGLVTDALE